VFECVDILLFGINDNVQNTMFECVDVLLLEINDND